jgi:hypothetical protein
MDYLEGRNFCDPELFPRILSMEKSKRHDAVNPPILPEVMRIVLQESFFSEKYPVLSHDYFTAKNILTGEIKITSNTVTVHHFATQYHSEEWRGIRAFEQNIKLKFGETSFISKLICCVAGIIHHTQEIGPLEAVKYYFTKYIKKENWKG